MAGREWGRGVCAAHTAPAARARARRVHREVWHFDSALLSHRVFRAAQVPLAPAGLVCVVADGLWGRGDVRLVGCREHIFSEAGGAVAEFAASNEFVFGTSLQRFLTFPLCVRFHYGHPDVWDKQWALCNGGVSKASRTLHLSEDIFGGMNVVMRGGAVSYQEFIHVGKGRDMTFTATDSFTSKISGGNALQSIARDMHRLNEHFDLARVLSLWATGPGAFASTTFLVRATVRARV